MAVFGKASKAKLAGLDPMMILLLGYAIKDTPIDFTIDAGKRDQVTQKMYYSWGRTVVNPNTGPLPGKPFGMIITQKNGVTNKSDHQDQDGDGDGEAVDIYSYYNGKIQLNDVASLRIITDHLKKCAKELGISIICGIDWSKGFVDPPHVQLA